MKFTTLHARHPTTVWVDFDATEVYAFAANWPDFGPKTVPLSLEISLLTGKFVDSIGVTDDHDAEAIGALTKYAFDRIPRAKPAPKGWLRRIVDFLTP